MIEKPVIKPLNPSLRGHKRANGAMRFLFHLSRGQFIQILSRRQIATTPEVTGEVGIKLALSRHQVGILRKCLIENGITELMTIVKRTDRTKFRHQVLNPLIEAGLLEMTIPDKPTSSKQKYRLTEQGKRLLKENE